LTHAGIPAFEVVPAVVLVCGAGGRV
jgi:hypothetical protein